MVSIVGCRLFLGEISGDLVGCDCAEGKIDDRVGILLFGLVDGKRTDEGVDVDLIMIGSKLGMDLGFKDGLIVGWLVGFFDNL